MYLVFKLIVILIGWSFILNAQAATHRPQDFLDSIKGKKNEGELIVQHFCANCHAAKPLIVLGAPRIGQEKDWDSRINVRIKDLLQHTTEGINAMPPRGGCFECSDDQLILAILAMLPEDLKKRLLLDLKVYKKNS